MDVNFITVFVDNLVAFVQQPNAFRSLIILLLSVIAAYWLSRIVERLIIRVAQTIAVWSDDAPSEGRKIQLRRVETYLSVAVALVRALIVGIVAFYTWQLLSPSVSISTATIGASAFFIVIAGATVGMILRDITAGSTMILERWFDIGDYIRIEPFIDVGGVVEQITLRSTKLRNMNGEVVWVHNQYIQGVKVTPKGLRTIAVDVFANDGAAGEALIEWVLKTIPIGPMTVTDNLQITRKEKWDDKLWFFTIVGRTPPGREWVIEDYFIDSLNESNENWQGGKVLIRKPMVRYADTDAERSFKRAVRRSKAG